MELGFRWYGANDQVNLNHIRQIPNMKQVVSAIYDIPVGEVLPQEKIRQLKQMAWVVKMKNNLWMKIGL